jgi:hypothetical protein
LQLNERIRRRKPIRTVEQHNDITLIALSRHKPRNTFFSAAAHERNSRIINRNFLTRAVSRTEIDEDHFKRHTSLVQQTLDTTIKAVP